MPPPTPAQLKATAQAKYHDKAIYACANYSWINLGNTEVVRGPDYKPSRTVTVQFRGDPSMPAFCDGLVVAADVRLLDKEVESKGASSPRSPLSARSILPYSARIALSDVLKTKDLDKDKEKKSISSGTLYVGMSESRLVGFRASAPFKHEITLPTKNRKQEPSTASYDFSNKVRTLKM